MPPPSVIMGKWPSGRPVSHDHDAEGRGVGRDHGDLAAGAWRVYEALRAGACGFLLKHAPPEELLLGVRAAADGGALLSPAVTSRLLAEFAARRPAPAREPAELARLTPREREVLELVIRGRSNDEIARDLVVSHSTVKTHVTHVLDKLGLRDRVHAVVYGYEHGLIEPGQAG